MGDPIKCPCGQEHSGPAWDLALKFVETRGETVVVRTPKGSILVPRVYIAMHGLKAKELLTLADKFGWRQA